MVACFLVAYYCDWEGGIYTDFCYLYYFLLLGESETFRVRQIRWSFSFWSWRMKDLGISHTKIEGTCNWWDRFVGHGCGWRCLIYRWLPSHPRDQASNTRRLEVFPIRLEIHLNTFLFMTSFVLNRISPWIGKVPKCDKDDVLRMYALCLQV